MAYSYNGILQSSEQKWTIATHNRYNDEWKKHKEVYTVYLNL